MERTKDLLCRLTGATGVPGFEGEVRQILREEMAPHTHIQLDRLGCIIAKKTGAVEEPKVMLAAHMDEIGFMVKSITPEGFLRFTPLGGWSDQVLLAQRVTIKGSKGDIPGVIGSKPPHLQDEEERKKLVKRKDMFIDVGARDKNEAESFGIRPGDPIVPAGNFATMRNENLLLAKAWDDRAGCALLIEVCEELSKRQHPNTVYAVGTVQEEVGTRGAATSVASIDPDVAIILDVSIAGDVPGLKEEVQEKLGEGPTVCLYDASMIPNINLRNICLQTAEELGIPYQYSVMERGGTDGGRIHLHNIGVPSLVIGIPVRYIHSHAGILHLEDYCRARRLITELILRLDAGTVAGLID
ncbi:MAG TPA: M42 family metallopeptidase [Firmicutes bacterium]|jgi:putative aminopeptidase FrvX|nr:M42 family metallopeptidase [Bacillota bacterium]